MDCLVITDLSTNGSLSDWLADQCRPYQSDPQEDSELRSILKRLHDAPAVDRSRIVISTASARRSASDLSLALNNELLNSTAQTLQALCALGGAKIIVNLIRLWVEERKGRKVHIRKGDIEIALEGTPSKTALDQVLNLLETCQPSQSGSGTKPTGNLPSDDKDRTKPAT